MEAHSPKPCKGFTKKYEFRQGPRHIDVNFVDFANVSHFGDVRYDTTTYVWSQILMKLTDPRDKFAIVTHFYTESVSFIRGFTPNMLRASMAFYHSKTTTCTQDLVIL